jgi:hypothetical protein
MLDRFNGVTFQRPRSDILNALLSLPAVAGETFRSLDAAHFLLPDFEKIEGRA